MSEPVVPSVEQQAELWRMKPAAAVTDLPSTGAAVLRWQRSTTTPYRFERTAPREHVLLSVMLAPMQTRANVGNRQVWSGPIQSGRVRLLQPSPCASWDSDSAFDILHVYLPDRALIAAAQDQEQVYTGFRGTHRPLYQHDNVVALIARQLALTLDEGGRCAREHADISVRLLIAHLLNNYESSPPLQSAASPGLMAAFRHIEHHPGERLGIDQLAAVAAMSEFHFAREFKRVFGTSPHAQVLAVRLQLARKALGLPGKTVLEIALDCGFVDSSHFARVFRQAYGLSPTAFRSSRLNA